MKQIITTPYTHCG